MNLEKEWEEPTSELAKLIAQKWFLPLEKLSSRVNIPITCIVNAVRGRTIHPVDEARLKKFFRNYKGELVCDERKPMLLYGEVTEGKK